MPITVAIVEENAGICLELQHAISRAPDLQLVALCRDPVTATRLLPAFAPDVILMDIQPGQSGLECTAQLKFLLPQAQILIFTLHDKNAHILQALEAGAIGYILQSAPTEDILHAIREAHQGGAPMTREVARKVIESFHKESPVGRNLQQLTLREREVVELLSKGYLDKQIADHLAISFQTVNSHLKHIYAKLGAHSRTEVAVKYLHSSDSPQGVWPKTGAACRI